MPPRKARHAGRRGVPSTSPYGRCLSTRRRRHAPSEFIVPLAMQNLFSLYTEKLIRADLAVAGTPLLGLAEAARDGNNTGPRQPARAPAAAAAPAAGGTATFVWNRDDPLRAPLERAARRWERRAVLAARPPDPYGMIVRHLAAAPGGVIRPQDFETRVFLTDLPVWKTGREEDLAAALKKRRGAVTPDGTIIATAKGDLERAFVIYSAACFAVFVKFCADLLPSASGPGPARDRAAGEILDYIRAYRAPGGGGPIAAPRLSRGPFTDEAAILRAMAAAGRTTVTAGLVNANFGNISYRRGDELFITRRGSALDDLDGRIVAVPLPGPSAADAAASIELPTHRRIVLETPCRAVLHGHPQFIVILSLDCREGACPHRGECHRFCPRTREIAGVPVVSGEAGAGPYGLDRTVPPAVRKAGAAIVHGHGIFTAAPDDFQAAFARLQQIETSCRELFWKTVVP